MDGMSNARIVFCNLNGAVRGDRAWHRSLFLQEAALERAARDRAAMLLQVSAAAQARLQAKAKWVERTKVSKRQIARPIPNVH